MPDHWPENDEPLSSSPELDPESANRLEAKINAMLGDMDRIRDLTATVSLEGPDHLASMAHNIQAEAAGVYGAVIGSETMSLTANSPILGIAAHSEIALRSLSLVIGEFIEHARAHLNTGRPPGPVSRLRLRLHRRHATRS